jgi:hypothetical protein
VVEEFEALGASYNPATGEGFSRSLIGRERLKWAQVMARNEEAVRYADAWAASLDTADGDKLDLPQVLRPYMRNFERARDAASELVYNYSLLGLKTDLAAITQPGGADGETVSGVEAFKNRLRVFLGGKSNNNLAVVDKANEEFFQINTPLAGVEGLVAQQLELVALIPRTPITKLFGFPPRGFNATGEHEQTNFYDRLTSLRPNLLVDQFAKARTVVELSEFGAVNAQVTEKWPDYEDPNALEEAQISLMEAQRDSLLKNSGFIWVDEARSRMSDDPASGFAGINPDRTPPPADLADPSLMTPPDLSARNAATPEEQARSLTRALGQALQQRGL